MRYFAAKFGSCRMQRRRKQMQHLWSRLSLLLALLVLAIATSSAGTQVTLGQSTIGDVLFINTGPDSASFSFTGMCGARRIACRDTATTEAMWALMRCGL